MTGFAARQARKPETRKAPSSTQSVLQLRAAQEGERKLLLAVQAAGYALLHRSLDGLAGKAAARAHAETATLFAHRWAEIGRAPAMLREAMAAALQAEQTAALSAHTQAILGQLQHQHRCQRSELRALFAAHRRALTARQRQASAGVTMAVTAGRPAPDTAEKLNLQTMTI